MKIKTLSIIAGTTACNAHCPPCISKMTPTNGMGPKPVPINHRNLDKACYAAKIHDADTVMITGKGEPTLFPDEMTEILEAIEKHHFPFIELQTNGIRIARMPELYAPHLRRWYELGLNTIAISVFHFDAEENRKIYVPDDREYIDLPKLIAMLHGFGFSVRLTCVMTRGRIDSVEKFKQIIAFAKANKVEQLTLTPVKKPADFSDDNDEQKKAWLWTEDNYIVDKDFDEIKHYVELEGAHLLTLPHGAKVFDIDGQNLCLSNCLTVQPDVEDMRNLIYFPDGHIRYYWQYPGAILM